MAEITPFRGIIYSTDKINDLRDVVAPPFDVISPKEQQGFYDRHPKNVIRLILGKKKAGDSDADNTHTRAAAYFNQWLEEGTLVRDDKPAIYLTEVGFPLDGRMVTRYGFIATVRLEPFEKKIVLPHEKTFSKVKTERLGLMKECHSNFSPIFSLYPHSNGMMESLKNAVAETKPAIDIVLDDSGVTHKLWKITDPKLHELVGATLADQRLVIADGHHRYETALNYREWVKKRTPDFSENHPANFVMMYLCAMEDPGLIILPAHRLLKQVSVEMIDGLIESASDFFDIQTIPYDTTDGTKSQKTFLDGLASGIGETTIGMYARSRSQFHLLTLKPGVMEKRYGTEMPAELLDIDATVLTQLIFMDLLGFTNERLDDEQLIGYSSVSDTAIKLVNDGEYDVAFFLNPTRIEQVRSVCEAGLTMPRKATYFYPKVLSGRVLNSLLK